VMFDILHIYIYTHYTYIHTYMLICNIVDSQHTNVGTGLNSGPLGWTTGPETTAQFNKRLLRQCAASATLSTEAAIFTRQTYIHTYRHTYIYIHLYPSIS
jgi:hypothetical protein